MKCKNCNIDITPRHKKGLCNKCRDKETYNKWRENNREKESIKFKQWVKKNKEYDKLRQKIWKKNNREKDRETRKKSHNLKMKTDVEYKLRKDLSDRILLAIKNQATDKAYSSIKLLGCTIQECRKYIEQQWQEGMNWNNHSKFGWHIDHIVPLSSFNLTKEEEQIKAFHYTNLQPLWWRENLSKGAKI